MKITRFMEVMFSNDDEELAKQVDKDIKTAQRNGEVDTEEVKYERTPDGSVAITDKENGEVTIAQKATDEADTYDLIAVPDEQLEKFLHPSDDGIHFGNQVGTPDEHFQDHFGEDDVISPNLEDGGLNPDAGKERRIADMEQEDNEKEFSVYSDNTVVHRIFQDQEFCERVFSEVIESEETAKVGDLKIEKIDDEENSVVVTDETTGDQAKIVLDDDEMKVTELDSKNFSDEDQQFMPYFVVGIQPFDHIIVDAQEWDLESAKELKNKLTEDGVEAVEIFDSADDARDHAMKLIDGLDAAVDEDEEPELQKEYSEFVGAPVFATRLYSYNTDVMCRMFSEAVNGISDLQDEVEDAIREGDEIEMDDVIITPVDAQNAVIEDKESGEFTKATVSGEDMRLEQIDEDEAEDIMSDLSILESESDENQPLSDDDDDEDDDVCPKCGQEECECDDSDDEDDDEDDEEEKEYSYCDETETRFFSEDEEFTDYMTRLYSGYSDQDAIEDALENGDEIETDDEVITPVDSKTAVVEDKENGEFTKVTILDEDAMNVHPISEEEAENLTGDLVVDRDNEVDEDEDDEEEEEKEYSYCDETETRFFSADEDFSDYMMRIYSEEADQDEIEKAIEDGEQIENDDEVITPVDSKTAIIEDKENGEFTKAVIDGDEIDMNKITEDEADELTDGLAVEDNDADEDDFDDIDSDDDGQISKDEWREAGKSSDEFARIDKNKDGYISKDEWKDYETGEKNYSMLDKFFAEVAQQAAQAVPQAQPAVGPQQSQAIPVQNPVQDQLAGQPQEGEQVEEDGEPMTHTVEEVEDKALAAVQSIKAAAEEAAATIMEAKAAPVEDAEPDVQEAQFSERTFSDYDDIYEPDDTLTSWLNFK